MKVQPIKIIDPKVVKARLKDSDRDAYQLIVRLEEMIERLKNNQLTIKDPIGGGEG